MSEKNEIVNVAENQSNPYDAKASDFPYKHVAARHGQDSGAAPLDGPGSPGYNDLVKLGKNQEGTRHAQDGVSEANDSMDENAKAVAANFKVERSKGESNSMPMSPDMPESVDLLTGKFNCGGQKPTRVGEVMERHVSIG